VNRKGKKIKSGGTARKPGMGQVASSERSGVTKKLNSKGRRRNRKGETKKETGEGFTRGKTEIDCTDVCKNIPEGGKKRGCLPVAAVRRSKNERKKTKCGKKNKNVG